MNNIAEYQEPASERVWLFKRTVSPERYERERAAAMCKLKIVDDVRLKRHQSGKSWRKCLAEVAPAIHWPTYRGWRRRLGKRPGPEWERLIDTRDPPKRPSIPLEVRAFAVGLRRGSPAMLAATARVHLVDHLGMVGHISDSALYRIWRQEGLSNPQAGDPGRFERVEHFSGGGAFALLVAASIETNAPLLAAKAALEAGNNLASGSKPPTNPVNPPRDEWGRFTAEFNKQLRAGVKPGEVDHRWQSDSSKRAQTDLRKLQVLKLSPEILGNRILSMGVVPMLSERRGFDGLSGPQGAWLGVLGQWAYMPATLDKTLAELALLGADQALWDAHAKLWAPQAQAWARAQQDAPDWLPAVRYVDVTREPYWTQQFAPCGNVERVGQNMPCVTRLTITAGPGMILRMINLPGAEGAASLRTSLPDILKSVDGFGERPKEGWLLVVDAEAAVYHLLTTLQELEGYRFITVLKGQIRKSAKLQDPGEWQAYRERDRLRCVGVLLDGARAPAGGLKFRGVELHREGARHSHSTLFIAKAGDELSTQAVPDAYLSRWPNQEGVFRNYRNGGGLERTHGYGGQLIPNSSLETKKEAAANAAARCEARLKRSQQLLEQSQALAADLADEGKEAADALVQQSSRQSKIAQKAATKSMEQVEQLDKYPTQTFSRDTTRENIVTAATTMVMLLVEWVLREYFGGLRMEIRTFIEHFMLTPVTVRYTRYRVRYQLQANPRDPERTEQLRKACAEVTKRRLRRDGRLIGLEVVDSLPESRDESG